MCAFSDVYGDIYLGVGKSSVSLEAGWYYLKRDECQSDSIGAHRTSIREHIGFLHRSASITRKANEGDSIVDSNRSRADLHRSTWTLSIDRPHLDSGMGAMAIYIQQVAWR